MGILCIISILLNLLSLSRQKNTAYTLLIVFCNLLNAMIASIIIVRIYYLKEESIGISTILIFVSAVISFILGITQTSQPQEQTQETLQTPRQEQTQETTQTTQEPTSSTQIDPDQYPSFVYYQTSKLV
jgi:hypothetical protein